MVPNFRVTRSDSSRSIAAQASHAVTVVPASASPFLPAAGAAAAPAARTARWELIAIMGTREIPAVRIRDTANDTAAWLGLGETFGTIRVVAADLAASTATVQAGTERPEELIVDIRIRLTPERRLAAPPEIVSRGSSPRYQAAADAAMRAVLQGQPYEMLRAESYDQWKDMIVTFDPRQMFRS